MKIKTIKIKTLLFFGLIAILVLEAGVFLNMTVLSSAQEKAEETAAKKISSIISADGQIVAQNQATLHFQTGGKLSSLPVKQGDKVYQGQTIAQLDTYTLQKSLQLAANSYQISKNSTDTTNENNKAGVLEGQQRVSLDASNKTSYSEITEAQVITDTVKRLVDNSKLFQDSAQLNVDLANYAVQLATLTSPLNGVVTHEDVTVAGVNITTTTSFTVADPTSVVFRANISENDIDYVTEGAKVIIRLDGSQKKLEGTVTKIYPAKVTLSSGQSVYQVDVESTGLKNAKLDQSGTVLINSNVTEHVTLVPMWTVLSGKYVWVDNNGKKELREVKVGKVHGTEIEILGGLSDDDKVITDPKSLTNNKYILL